MQTAIDYVFEQLEENSLFFTGTENQLNISISASDYLDLKRLAKEMHKAEHGKTWDAALDAGQSRAWNVMRAYEDFDDYFAETYGSKGSETKQ